MVREGGNPVVKLERFVCPTVSMVTTSKATGPEKTLLEHPIPPHSQKGGYGSELFRKYIPKP